MPTKQSPHEDFYLFSSPVSKRENAGLLRYSRERVVTPLEVRDL